LLIFCCVRRNFFDSEKDEQKLSAIIHRQLNIFDKYAASGP